MKKRIIKFAQKKGLTCNYSGKEKILYLKSNWETCGFNHVNHIYDLIVEKFGILLPFRISF